MVVTVPDRAICDTDISGFSARSQKTVYEIELVSLFVAVPILSYCNLYQFLSNAPKG